MLDQPSREEVRTCRLEWDRLAGPICHRMRTLMSPHLTGHGRGGLTGEAVGDAAEAAVLAVVGSGDTGIRGGNRVQ